MKKTLALGLAALVLCQPAFAIRLNDQVQLMSEPARRGFIGMLLKKSGAACTGIKRTFYQGALDEKNSVWNAECDAKKSYAVLFADDGANTTRVLSCNELKGAGAKADCFQKF